MLAGTDETVEYVRDGAREATAAWRGSASAICG